nr:hypothetical protein [Tanacetum cinerariifolium]
MNGWVDDDDDDDVEEEEDEENEDADEEKDPHAVIEYQTPPYRPESYECDDEPEAEEADAEPEAEEADDEPEAEDAEDEDLNCVVIGSCHQNKCRKRADEATEGEKRKGESNRGGRGDNR